LFCFRVPRVFEGWRAASEHLTEGRTFTMQIHVLWLWSGTSAGCRPVLDASVIMCYLQAPRFKYLLTTTGYEMEACFMLNSRITNTFLFP